MSPFTKYGVGGLASVLACPNIGGYVKKKLGQGYHITSGHPTEHPSWFLAPKDKVYDSSETLKIDLFLWFLLLLCKILDLNELLQFFQVSIVLNWSPPEFV